MERRLYEIWMGAHHHKGKAVKPWLVGSAYGYSFREACINLLYERMDFDSEKIEFQEVPLYDNHYDAFKRLWKSHSPKDIH